MIRNGFLKEDSDQRVVWKDEGIGEGVGAVDESGAVTVLWGPKRRPGGALQDGLLFLIPRHTVGWTAGILSWQAETENMLLSIKLLYTARLIDGASRPTTRTNEMGHFDWLVRNGATPGGPVFRPFKPIRHVRCTVHGICVCVVCSLL